MGNILTRSMKLLLHVLFAFILVTRVSAQAPDTMQRVKTIRHFYSTYGSSYGDSLVFSYSGNQASTFSPFGYHTHRGYNSFPSVNDINADLPEPLEDRYKMSMDFDSMDRYMLTNTTTLLEKYFNSFSGTNVISRNKKVITGIPDWYRYLYSSDLNGNTTAVYELKSDTAGVHWDTSAYHSMVYDSQNQIITDTSRTYYTGPGFVSASSYIYRDRSIASHKRSYLASGSWYDNSNTSYLYDGKGRFVQKIEERFYPGTATSDTVSNQFVRYDDQSRVVSMVSRHMQNTSRNDSIIEFNWRYRHPVSKKPDTMVRYTYNGRRVMNCTKTVFFYNKYDNPDSVISYVYDDCVHYTNKDARTYYTYELYTPLQDSAVTPVPKGKLVIFPNPARDVIKIRWNEEKPAAAYVSLYNSLGQLVGDTHIPKTQDEDSITLPGLAAGVYYIRITTGGGGRLYSGGITVQ